MAKRGGTHTHTHTPAIMVLKSQIPLAKIEDDVGKELNA